METENEQECLSSRQRKHFQPKAVKETKMAIIYPLRIN